MQLYYLCTQAQFAYYWYRTHNYIPHVAVEDGDVHPIPLSSILTHTRLGIPRSEINPVNTTIAAWRALGHRADKLPLYSSLLPLAQHADLCHTRGRSHAYTNLSWH